MTTKTLPAQRGLKLSEDWLATIIGLVIVAIVGGGLLGPGGQTVTVNTPAGETKSAAARPVSGWQPSATLDGNTVVLFDAPRALTVGQTVVFTCADRAISVSTPETLPEGISAPASGRAQLVVDNGCEADVNLTYRIPPAVPWPLLNLSGR